MSKSRQLLDLIEKSFRIEDLKDEHLLGKLRELYKGDINHFLGHSYYQQFSFKHRYLTRVLVIYSNFNCPNTRNPHETIRDGKGDEIIKALPDLEFSDANQITSKFNPKPIGRATWMELVKLLAESKFSIHIDHTGKVLGISK